MKNLIKNLLNWSRKNKTGKDYCSPDIKILEIEAENGFMVGSNIKTEIKPLNIEAEPFEKEEHSWYGNEPTFD